MITEEFDGRLSGGFILKHVFNMAEQIHTVTCKRISIKDYELIVSQPGGNLIRFNPNEENGKRKRLIDLTMKQFMFRSNLCNRYIQF
jgi:hypothetical protein